MLVSFQRAHNVVAVETQFGSEIGKILDAADVATLLEVRREQALLHLELAPAQLRVVQQLVRLDRVGVLQRVVVVVQAHAVGDAGDPLDHLLRGVEDRKSTRLNSSHVKISYAVFCLKKKR